MQNELHHYLLNMKSITTKDLKTIYSCEEKGIQDTISFKHSIRQEKLHEFFGRQTKVPSLIRLCMMIRHETKTHDLP